MALVAASDSAAPVIPGGRSGNLIRLPATVSRHRIAPRIATPRDGYTSFSGNHGTSGFEKDAYGLATDCGHNNDAQRDVYIQDSSVASTNLQTFTKKQENASKNQP